ncbi:hypothetical protein ACJMK2_024391 [Sinanodonta woodiana]|uniref:Uncharacterized protein n=1 Tax=Sinanodonta woodiana TaxID=1069815 RepID=A0ABD3T8V9_SINWO
MASNAYQSSQSFQNSQQGSIHPVDPEEPQPQEQEENLRGSRSRLSRYFEVQVEGDTLYAFHSRGCQLISFSGVDKPPKQAEILMSLQTLGVNMRGIRGLQNAGKSNYMLYPVAKETKLLKFDKFYVFGKVAHVLEAPTFTRQIGPKTTDIHITGLPIEVDEDELCNKIYQRFNVEAKTSKEANIWGWSYIASGVRIITVAETDAHKFPLFLTACDFESDPGTEIVNATGNAQTAKRWDTGHGTANKKKLDAQPTTIGTETLSDRPRCYAEVAQTTLRPQEKTYQEE